MEYNHIENVLVRLHKGQWFGWSDVENKVYANFIIHDNDSGRDFLANNEKPTQEFLDSELVKLQREWAESEFRFHRNQLLFETDYFALSDVTMTAEMTSYRQALRDLPENTEDVFNPVYPEKPK